MIAAKAPPHVVQVLLRHLHAREGLRGAKAHRPSFVLRGGVPFAPRFAGSAPTATTKVAWGLIGAPDLCLATPAVAVGVEIDSRLL